MTFNYGGFSSLLSHIKNVIMVRVVFERVTNFKNVENETIVC